MKIDNKTDYDGRYLRKLFMACERNEGTDHRRRRVRVVYARCREVSGYAYYDSNFTCIRVAKGGVSAHRVAKVYIHEVGHNNNLRHGEMSKWWEWEIKFWPDEEIPLKGSIANPKVKVKKSAVEIREERTRKNLERWEKKMKSAAGYVKKYRAKVRYYDNRRKKAALNKEE